MAQPRALMPVFAAVVVVAVVLTVAIASNHTATPRRSALAEAFAAAGDAAEFNITRWDRIADVVGDEVADAAARNAISRSLLAGSDAQIADQLSWRVTDLVWETYVSGVDGFIVARFGSTVDVSDETLREEFAAAELTPLMERFARHVEVRDGIIAAGPNAEAVSDALDRALKSDLTIPGAELAAAATDSASLWISRGDLECAGTGATWSLRALTLRDEPTDLQIFARLFADLDSTRADVQERQNRVAALSGTEAVEVTASGHVSVVTMPVDPDEQEFMSGPEPPGYAGCALD